MGRQHFSDRLAPFLPLTNWPACKESNTICSCLLLCAGSKWPSRAGATTGDELAAPHGSPQLWANVSSPQLAYYTQSGMTSGMNFGAASAFPMSGNGMVRPCSGPASMRSWQGALKTRSTPCLRNATQRFAVIGIDIGKNSFHIVGHDHRGAIVLRQKWSRGQGETRLANLPPCRIGMEACVGTHHLSRTLKAIRTRRRP